MRITCAAVALVMIPPISAAFGQDKPATMTPEALAEIAAALAWPLTAIALVAVFYKPVRTLLDRLSSTLTIKTITLKAFGQVAELTTEQAKRALDELLKEIAEPANELCDEESKLFKRIMAAADRDTVGQLIPGFQRDTPEHLRLRKLRDRHLIRPFEGGRWKSEKHPVVTRFGRLVYDLRRSQPPKDAA